MSDDSTAGLPGLTGLSPDELDLLADLLAGEGTEEQVAQVAADPRLAGALADLEAAQAPVAADLAGLPEVEPPPGFLDRLTAVLVAQPSYDSSGERDVTGGPAPAAGGSTVVTLARARPGAGLRSTAPWVFRSAAAAVLVLVLVGGGLLLATRNGGSSDSRSSAGSAAALQRTVPTSSTGTNYTSPDDVGKALPALLKGTSKAAAPAVPAPAGSSATAPALADPLARLRQPDELQGCLSSLGLAPGTTPLALDYASYKGTPALLVVLPATKAGTVDVYALGADCTATADHTVVFLPLPLPG